MTTYAVRITRSYEHCRAAVSAWALKCDKILAYEHIGTVTEKVHIHLIMVGVRVTVDTLKDIARPLGLATLKGNGDWSFKTKSKKYGPVTDSPTYITYMTKGKYDPLYNKGYSQEEVDEAKKMWKDYDNEDARRIEYNKWRSSYLGDIDIPKTAIVSLSGTTSYPGFTIVRTKALEYAFKKHRLLSPAAIGMMKTYTLTYCYEESIAYDSKFLWK